MKRFFLLACVAAVGCSGGGLDHFLADAGTNPDSAQSVQSDGSHTLASLSDVCTALPPSGYLNPTNKTFVAAVPTGADLLALMQPSYTGTYVPQGDPAGYVFTGSLAPTAITIGTQYSGGTISCGPVLCSCDPPGPCGVDRCSGPSLTVEITQTVQTADGVFNEVVPSTIASPEGDGRIDIHGQIPATQLHGSYPISFGTPEQVKLLFDLYADGATIQSGLVGEMTTQISGGGGSIQ